MGKLKNIRKCRTVDPWQKPHFMRNQWILPAAIARKAAGYAAMRLATRQSEYCLNFMRQCMRMNTYGCA